MSIVYFPFLKFVVNNPSIKSTPDIHTDGQLTRVINEKKINPIQTQGQYFDAFTEKLEGLSPNELVLFTYAPVEGVAGAPGEIHDNIRFRIITTEEFAQGIQAPEGCQDFDIHTLVFAVLTGEQVDRELVMLKKWLGIPHQYQFIFHIIAPSSHPVKLFYQDNLIHFGEINELINYIKSFYSSPYILEEPSVNDLLKATEKLLDSEQIDLASIEKWEQQSDPVISELLDKKNLVKNFRSLQSFKDLKNLIFILTYLKMIINTHSKSYVLQTTIEAKERLNKFKNAYHK